MDEMFVSIKHNNIQIIIQKTFMQNRDTQIFVVQEGFEGFEWHIIDFQFILNSGKQPLATIMAIDEKIMGADEDENANFGAEMQGFEGIEPMHMFRRFMEKSYEILYH